MFPIVGTIRNAVKLAELDNKWQQKKQKGGKAFSKEPDPMTRQIMQYKEDLEKMRESRAMADIGAKIKSGGDLTPDELEYLQKNNPQMYREYMEIKSEKEAYKRELKSCKTKEDVEKLKMNKMNGYLAEAKSVMNNPNIPKGQKLAIMEKILMKTAGVQKVHMEFVNSAYYKSLPTDEELAEEVKEKTGKKEVETEAEVELSQEGAEEDTVPQGEIKPDNTQTEQIPQDVFEEVKTELKNYIKDNRPKGYGLEYI